MKTNSNNINNSKSNKTKSIIALTSLTIILSIVNITLLTGTIFGININTTTNASALSYSTSEDISFTFAPTLSIGLSSDSLTIDNLVPGTTSDSNTVSVTVSSNTPYGYVLSAGVGSDDTTSPYYNTSSLTHENTTISNVFSSVDTNASLDSLDTDNTWGYSTSANGGTSWSTYSGLSNTTTKPLLDISDPATPSTIDFKIAARSASTQASGTYNNIITFYAVGKPEPVILYDEVAKMSKGTQTMLDLQANITKDNSGVYKYNSLEFGTASDASNDYDIYYYRGIIDSSFTDSSSLYGDIGSSGDGTLYPNYVILAAGTAKLTTDTCWRIVRTTGSGGVKMIYNGTWTGSTCANIASKADSGATVSYNSNSYQIVKVGYTYNDTYAVNTAQTATIAEVFGSDLDSSINDTDSILKEYLENTFYPTYLHDYTSILEPSAGYCNDRSLYSASSPFVLQPDSTNIITYKNRTELKFGAYIRNSLTLTENNNSPITLNCPRNTVDLYTTASATDGNKQLSQPIALLTADEIALAGGGTSDRTQGSSYHMSSYIRYRPDYYSLSPIYINRYGIVYGFKSLQNGALGSNDISSSYDVKVRPAISLKPVVAVISGSGTATDPWVVPAP